MKSFFAPRNLLVCVLVCAVFGAGCSSWRSPSRPVVSKSGKPYAYPQKYEFKGDLRVALVDSSVVELRDAYAVDYILYGTAKSKSIAIRFDDITKVEEKHTPTDINLRVIVLVSLIAVGFALGIGSAL